MRLRSSQFVFLLLLVCSVQVHADYAAQLLAGAEHCKAVTASSAHADSPTAASAMRPAPNRAHTAATIPLDDAARASHCVVWSVRQPALDAASVASFTGFLRA